jgi:hypothetical protein
VSPDTCAHRARPRPLALIYLERTNAHSTTHFGTKFSAFPGKFEFCTEKSILSIWSRSSFSFNRPPPNSLRQLVSEQPISNNQKSPRATRVLYCGFKIRAQNNRTRASRGSRIRYAIRFAASASPCKKTNNTIPNPPLQPHIDAASRC